MSLWDPQLEQGVLAAALRAPFFAKRVARMPRNAWSSAQTLAVFSAFSACFEASQPVAAAAVQEQLRRDGSVAFAASLPRFLDSAARVPDVPAAVAFLEDIAKRQAGRVPALAIASAYAEGDYEAAERMVRELAANLDHSDVETNESFSTGEAVEAAIEAAVEDDRRPDVDLGPLRGLALHIREGNLIVIGGETNAGKSRLALTIARRWTASTSRRASIVSVEDRLHTWGGRALAHACGVNPNSGPLKRWDRDVLVTGAAELGRDNPYAFAILERNDVSNVLRHMRLHVRQEGCGLVIVDYLTEITDRHGPRGRPRREVVSDIARQIKECGKQLHVPVILCSQLRRPKDDKHREPTKHWLKETGDLENMAEAIALLWRESDDEFAPAFCKIDKLKESPGRPRVRLEVGDGGAITGFERIEPKDRQQVSHHFGGRA